MCREITECLIISIFEMVILDLVNEVKSLNLFVVTICHDFLQHNESSVNERK